MQFAAAHIDQIIMFCAAVWMTAAGFGYVAIDDRQTWLVRLVGHFRWMGPLLAVMSIALVFAK